MRAIVALTWTALALTLVASPSCDSATAEDPCSRPNVAGMTVAVVDEATAVRVCDAAVRAQEGLYWEALLPTSNDTASCVYQGAFEREGVYRVEASKAGYTTTVTQRVTIGIDDACKRVIPIELELQLTPQPQ